MPQVDGMTLRTGWTRRGESRFARPVAKVTAFVHSLAERTRKALEQRGGPGAPPSQSAQGEREDSYAGATDAHDLERMERDWDRRDGGGMRIWDWR